MTSDTFTLTLVCMSLLTDLRTIAATTLAGSELPTHVEVQDLLGAVIKTIEAAGITVADDLLPKPAAAIADAVIEAAAPVAQSEMDKALAEIEKLKAELLGVKASGPVPPAATSTPVPVAAGPVAPPIEGAS